MRRMLHGLSPPGEHPGPTQRTIAGDRERINSIWCDVLVTAAGPARLAAKRATSTLPIVAVGIPDPVGIGLINSLVRPGGNLTGLSSLSVDLTAKRVQLLQEALPNASRMQDR